MQWSEQLCYAELPTLAAIYFALGGFPCLCHMLHVSSNGVEGVGIMQDSPSAPRSCLHAEDAGYAFIQPACALLLFNVLDRIWLLPVQQ